MTFFKPLALTLMAALVLTSSSAPKDDDDHTLVSLWKQYYSAEGADKPKTQASILEKIKEEARTKHLAWDFYDASVRLAQVRISGNWKLRDSEIAARDKDIAELGEPIAEFYLKKDQLGQKEKRIFAENHAQKLKASHNPEFYKRDWHLNNKEFGAVLPDLLKNDYEYCLWNNGYVPQLKEEFKDYPLNAFAEYEGIRNDYTSGRFEAFAKKWDGKAAGLLAEQEILSLRYRDLSKKQGDALKGTSEEFRTLNDDCKAFNEKRASFKGDEKKIADCFTKADNLLGYLSAKNISVKIKDGKLTLRLQNMEAVTTHIFKGKEKVWDKYITNPYKSFYVDDELLLELPDLPDGTYTVKCFYKDISEEVDYNKYTISASTRRNADGIGIWAADFITGEPVKNVTVDLLKDGKVVESGKLVLNGYTALPKPISAKIAEKKNTYSLQVRCNDGRSRASKPLYLYDYYNDPGERSELTASLITDRGAYSPDDTLKFKAVVFTRAYDLRLAKAGLKIKAELKDASNKVIETQTLSTNEFGSVAGEMVLKRTGKNGNYTLTVSHDGIYLDSRAVTVDDFVLPTFDLIFDRESTFEHPIREISTGGRIYSYSGHSLSGANISYTVRHNSKQWAEGKLTLDRDGRFGIVFPTDDTYSGYDWYQITVKVVDATGETMEWSKSVSVYVPYTPAAKTEYYFDEKNKDGSLELKVVAGNIPVWMVVEAHGPGNRLLWKRVDHFVRKGVQSASTTVNYSLGAADPEVVTISVFYFQNRRVYSHQSTLRKPDTRYDMPLSFSRFQDTTVPGASYTFEIKTLPGAEIAATVFDKSTERFRGNKWSCIAPYELPSPYVTLNSVCGTDESEYSRIMLRGASKNMMLSKAAGDVMVEAAVPMVEEEMAVDRKVSSAQTADSSTAEDADIPIRENFANTIAWEPFIRSDKNGLAKLSFTNADKLSTYYVQLFAHDKSLRNETVRREMVVTIPVKISLAEPKFLYEGDKYVARIALSSAMAKDTRGVLNVQLLDGSDHRTAEVISRYHFDICVPAGSSVNKDVEIIVPGTEVLGIKATFQPLEDSEGADGIFVTVPVWKAVQTLTEAHSAVLLSGEDKAALEAGLRAMFVNVDGSLPALEEIDIRQMLRDAIPDEIEPQSENAIALSRAIYARSLLASPALAGNRPSATGKGADSTGIARPAGVAPEDDAVKKLLACRNADGGFGWFAGMTSSPLVTAVVLRLVHGLGIVDEAAAVHYIDSCFFAKEKEGWWYRGLSMEQYLHTRSFFPEVSFNEKTDADFRKEARAYLVPKKARGLNGMIAAKARRVQTLDNLLSLEGGTSLASKMGVKLGTERKLRKSLAADIESLTEYAQPHKSGGMYYPNAVMPWRGLLETELDAHCALMAIMDRFGHPEISNGIRLWIMIQKETQNWKQGPGYIEALGAVLGGPESILDTKVLALKAEYTLPFDKIKASGNGMTVLSSRAKPGDLSRIGDRLKVSLAVTNEENRSFLKVTIPFEAGLVPVNQLSGYRWGYYRNVLADRIECWYEVYPEEKTTVTEEFYVTRAGVFQAPVATIECEYAPHYRANDAWNGRLEVSAE
jgi:hypothetical protein